MMAVALALLASTASQHRLPTAAKSELPATSAPIRRNRRRLFSGVVVGWFSGRSGGRTGYGNGAAVARSVARTRGSGYRLKDGLPDPGS